MFATRLAPLLLCGSLLATASATAAVVGPASGLVDGVGAAVAWQRNDAGIGHINFVPYYAVLGGFDTYLNLTNTDTRNGKAVKLRFRAADNGDTVFDMTVLLSPGDQWAAALTRDAATGLPRLVHGDRSCTLPADVKHLFNTARLNPSGVLGDAGRAALAGVGSVELITMADIPPRTATNDPPLFTAIQQDQGVAPCTAGALAPLANDPLSHADAQAKGLEVPTTGLMTRWTLINVPRAVAYTGVATALQAVQADHQAGYGNLVLSPQTDAPIGSLAAVRSQTTDPLLRGGVADNRALSGMDLSGVSARVAARYSDLPDLSTPYLPQNGSGGLGGGLAPRSQVHALSQALAARSVANEYLVNPAIQAGTDWVLSLPTLRYGAAFDAVGGAAVYTNFAFDDLGQSIPHVGASLNDFTPSTVEAADARVNLWIRLSTPNLPGSSLRSRGPAYFDADGRQEAFFDIPLTPYSGLRLNGSASVVRLVRHGQPVQPVLPTAVGPSTLSGLPGASGWVRLYTPAAGRGLPVLGFAAMELFNAAATPGVAGVYGQTFPHSTSPGDPLGVD